MDLDLSRINIYSEANLIVETSKRCNRSCTGCYLYQGLRELDFERYILCISKIKKGGLVVLRGGEITLLKNWFNKFVEPALALGLKIVIESNGFFIASRGYEKILLELKNPDVFVRVSFDEMHFFSLSYQEKKFEFLKMAFFAKDAIFFRINFGFYSLGMSKNQIEKMIENTVLGPYLYYFHTLEYFTNISEVKLGGNYLKSTGEISDRIK